jgi:hypothetical protein
MLQSIKDLLESDPEQGFYLPLGKEKCGDLKLLLLLCRYCNLDLHITNATMESFDVTITDDVTKQVLYINPSNDTIAGSILIQMGFELTESCLSMKELYDLNMKVLKFITK